MPENKTHSDPLSSATIIEEDVDIRDTKDYGIGIDCHKLFIMVCVRTKKDGTFTATTARFDTDWNSLARAKEWCIEILRTKSDPIPDLTKPLHYVIESTATWHYPIRLCWGGIPSVINPTLAGATKRKTDRLDAKLLALHDQTSVWRESFLVPREVESLRLMIAERERCIREATAATSRIGNALTRFGFNAAREGSVTLDPVIRILIEDQISDSPGKLEGFCPMELPSGVRKVIRSEYEKFDHLKFLADDWKFQITEKAYSMQWETGSGTIPGTEMIPMLMTAPQIGEITAITWLSQIVTPNRFPNDRALAAYCGLDPSLKVSANHVTSTKKRGGCKQLHKTLCSCADRLIRIHNEYFGQWGYRIYNNTGKWKKASNAVARKLAVALYHMMITNKDFSYENYQIASKISSFDVPIEVLPEINHDFNRYIRILKEHDIHTTSDMVTAYLSCSLGSYRGLGKKFFGLLRDFTEHQDQYREEYEKLSASSEKEEPYESKT